MLASLEGKVKSAESKLSVLSNKAANKQAELDKIQAELADISTNVAKAEDNLRSAKQELEDAGQAAAADDYMDEEQQPKNHPEPEAAIAALAEYVGSSHTEVLEGIRAAHLQK